MTLSFLVSWANVSWPVCIECYALIVILLIMLLSFNIVIVMIILVIVLLWWFWLLLENRLILGGVVDKILSIISSSISIEPFLVVYTNILLLIINNLPITISSLLIHQLILWYLCIGVYLLMLVWRIPINTIGVI